MHAKPRTLLATVVVVGGLVLGGCAEPEEQVTASAAPTADATDEASAARAPKTFTLNKGDDGKKLSLTEGDKVSLTLETNPGTGYHWEYKDEPDTQVLKQGSDETKKPESSPGMVGVPEQRTWTYDAVGEGSTTVSLEYLPPGGGEPDDTFSFSATVAR